MSGVDLPQSGAAEMTWLPPLIGWAPTGDGDQNSSDIMDPYMPMQLDGVYNWSIWDLAPQLEPRSDVQNQLPYSP